MKVFSLLFCIVLLAAAAFAQSSATQPASPQPPDVQLVSFAFGQKTFTRLELRQIAPNSTATIPTGNLPVQAQFGGEPKPGREYYGYERQTDRTPYAFVSISNSGTKTVKAVDWEFVLPRFVKDKETVFFPVRSKQEIKPGATVELRQRLPRDDCGRGQAISYGTKFIMQTCGRQRPRATGWYQPGARITRVEYTDGSFWQRP
jgi:hypothetical protein